MNPEEKNRMFQEAKLEGYDLRVLDMMIDQQLAEIKILEMSISSFVSSRVQDLNRLEAGMVDGKMNFSPEDEKYLSQLAWKLGAAKLELEKLNQTRAAYLMKQSKTPIQ